LAGRPVATLLDGLAARADALTLEGAQVLAVVSSRFTAVSQRGAWPFPTLVDEGARIHRLVGAGEAAGKPTPAVLVTDRFREVYAAWRGSALPGAQAILDWLVFINIQCPECGWPEWPAQSTRSSS
jgi:hypothetical protein